MQKKLTMTLIAPIALASLNLVAQQDDRSGVAHPPEALVNDLPEKQVAIPPVQPYTPKPSAAIADTTSSTPQLKTRTADPFAPVAPVRSVAASEDADDDDSHIVTAAPAHENEIPAGTLLRIRVKQELGTDSATEGSVIVGELVDSLERDGKILLPSGTNFAAKVTDVRGGKRIRGAARMHIEPRTMTMPDGTIYAMHAVLADTDRFNDVKVDNEGNMIRRDHVGGTLAAMSLTTGGAAAVGGVIGGVPGALIGAAVGAGASTVWWLKQDRQMHLASGTVMVFQLTSPVMLNGARPVTGE